MRIYTQENEIIVPWMQNDIRDQKLTKPNVIHAKASSWIIQKTPYDHLVGRYWCPCSKLLDHKSLILLKILFIGKGIERKKKTNRENFISSLACLKAVTQFSTSSAILHANCSRVTIRRLSRELQVSDFS
jgi:hypothetical protein